MKIKIHKANTKQAHLFSGDSCNFIQASRLYYLLPYKTRERLRVYIEQLQQASI